MGITIQPDNNYYSNNDDSEPCGTCNKNVTWQDDKIYCDKCDKWYHSQCQNLSPETYTKLENSDEQWCCIPCCEPRRNREDTHQSKTTNLTRKAIKNIGCLKIGTLNCRGMRTETVGNTKKEHVAEDMRAYNLDILALQETHIESDQPEMIETIDKKRRYTIYYSHSSEMSANIPTTTRKGVAVVVREGAKVIFKPISDRLCVLKAKINENHTICLVNAYAPTLPISEERPEIRESFYEDLESVVTRISKREYLIVAGDFNAKTGKAWRDYPTVLGRYGKGEVNSNGKELLEFCDRQNLILTNTLFRHKMAHRTTWESPPVAKESDRRNQIDYTMARNEKLAAVIDSRSHNGMMTHTDHRLVRMKLNIRMQNRKKEQQSNKVDIEKLKDPITKAKYAFNVEMKIMDAEDQFVKGKNLTGQEMWDNIVQANHQTAQDMLKCERKRYTHNQKVQQLSEKQRL